MKKQTFIAATLLCIAIGSANAVTIIGSGGGVGVPSSGNGNFEDKTGAAPAPNSTWPTSEMPDWHNLSGAETQTSGSNQGIVGSPEPNSYGAYLFQSFLIGNVTGYTITNAGQTFDISMAVHQFGAAGNYNGDEDVVVNLFTSATGVTDSTVIGDITILGSTNIPVTGSWVSESRPAFYTSTLGDVGKTVYLGLTLSNPSGNNVFPRVDVVKLDVNAGSTNPPVVGPVIIGGSTGNGDFENSEPASGAIPYNQTVNWFNASGAETLNFTQDDQTGGSSQANSRAGMPFQNRKQVNDSGFTVTAAGQTFNLSYDFGRGGGGWDSDESLRTFLFTATAPVDGDLTDGEMTEFASVVYTIPSSPQWTGFATNGFYTTTAGDVGKTFYFGMEMNNPAGADVFPRIDVIEWVWTTASTNAPLATNGWMEFVSLYSLSGDKSADTDGDGQLDYLEFIHGGNPTNAGDLATEPSLQYAGSGTATYLSVETGHTNPGIPFTAEYTDNLATGGWQNVWDTETNTPGAPSGYNDVVREIDSGTNDQMYFRVRPLNSISRPNILVVMADDLGYADVSFNVSGTPDIPTPNLDSLAEAGTIFTSAYVVHPFCGPSRMGLFSGRYPHEFGGPYNLPIWSSNQYRDQGISTNETLISTVLQDAGYFTGLMGKWHMGETSEYHPNNRGFDDFYGFLGGGQNYFGPYVAQNGAGTVYTYNVYPEHNGVDDTSLTASDYITDVLTDKGVEFLNQAVTNSDPFFLFMSYNAPHTPLQAKASDTNLFPLLTGDRRIYAGMVNALDRGVSNLVSTLKANGQFDNTLIVFLSDNGGRTDRGAKNLPLKGVKGDAWEGGFRVPMFMHLPNVIPSGQRYDHPVTALDFYPTFADLAQAPIPLGKVIEGKDIWDDVILTRNARPGQPIYAVRYNTGYGAQGDTQVGIRSDQWKAVHPLGSDWRLYNITTDISETTDVSGTHPTILSNLVYAAELWATNNHVPPLWYDSFGAEADWISRGMPHYDTLFTPSLP